MELDERKAAILRAIVEEHISTAQPVGSQTIARSRGLGVSSATVRNDMTVLEREGYLVQPHTSAGRIPTEAGLRLFVNGLLELGSPSAEERANIDARCAATGRSLAQVLEEASTALSGLSRCAGLVVAPKFDRSLKHIEFVPLAPGRALVVMVTEDGMVENRVIDVPLGMPPSSLTTAGNYLNARLSGRSIAELRRIVGEEIAANRTELDALSALVVEAGLATWTSEGRTGSLIVRGQARMLTEVLRPGGPNLELAGELTGLVSVNPIDSVHRGRLAPALLQLALLVILYFVYKGAHFGRPVDPIAASRRRFSEHARAIGLLYGRNRAGRHALDC